MFWSLDIAATSSNLNKLLDGENVTLQDIMEEEDVLQELRTDNKKLVNFLIRCREYKQNGMVTPTEVGNEIFQACEAYFKTNRFQYRDKKGQIKILSYLISEKIKDVFNPPVCHRDKIVKRFVTNRLHFWASHINLNMKEVNNGNQPDFEGYSE